jgi:prepilin-type N-terminal cleavage/methylation domain-containing protein
MKQHDLSAIRAQSGFTLIEIAIVLVIIGLLIGGVLQGQQLIENSRVRAAVNDINGVQTAMYSYRDRYDRLPGDDGPIARLTGRGGAWANFTPASAGNADGNITCALANTFNPAGECTGFWQSLRFSGFISGDPLTVGVPALRQNAFGGLIGITNAETYQTAGVGSGQAGTKICLSQVPGAAASSIDSTLDDGLPNSGRVRAHVGVGNTAPIVGAPATVYVEASTHIVCVTV